MQCGKMHIYKRTALQIVRSGMYNAQFRPASHSGGVFIYNNCITTRQRRLSIYCRGLHPIALHAIKVVRASSSMTTAEGHGTRWRGGGDVTPVLTETTKYSHSLSVILCTGCVLVSVWTVSPLSVQWFSIFYFCRICKTDVGRLI